MTTLWNLKKKIHFLIGFKLDFDTDLTTAFRLKW
jgi:hypothetical protein